MCASGRLHSAGPIRDSLETQGELVEIAVRQYEAIEHRLEA